MKRHIAILLCSMIIVGLSAQSQFAPADYIDFINSNRTLNADGLLQKYPPQTSYYSSRTYPADLKTLPWFDTINESY
ncbi:MAG: hypothetical protein QNK33_00130, partial [Bacteroidales bacterium]|nr:hypothetical protein [Bacteroidales bacterium]